MPGNGGFQQWEKTESGPGAFRRGGGPGSVSPFTGPAFASAVRGRERKKRRAG